MRIRLILLAVIASCLTINAQEYRWGTDLLDGSMTGCTAASATNVEQALGMMDGDNYHAPSGKVYPGSSATSKVAALVLAAQPQMVDLKAVVAYTEEEMPHLKTEGTLSNWFVDIVTSKVSELVGTRMDVGICNLGGIRKGMPKGDVLLDDIQSMFPFKNYLVHLKMKGSELRKIFEFMATRKFEAISGATVEVTGGKVTSVLVGDSPLDDGKIYNVATISFLLNGGDGYYLANASQEVNDLGVLIYDAVMEHINACGAAGRPLKGSDVRRVIIK